MNLSRLAALAGTAQPTQITEEAERVRSFHEVLRNAKTIRIDDRGGDKNLHPHIEIDLADGTQVLISGDDDEGKDIGWGYEDESYVP
jgi:hypothetical protein